MTVATPPFVKGLQVLTSLARAAVDAGDLPSDLKVFTKLQDFMDKHLPALLIERAGGASDRPEFVSDFFVHFQVWSDRTTEFPNDPFQAAFELSQKVAAVFYNAWKQQTVALDADGHALGWIVKWRESSGFQDTTSSDLPHIGRYVGVYDLKIRNRRPNSV